MNVVLIGFSGTGKSSVGNALARRLGWQFVDTDVEVVRAAGKPIHKIFADEGEAVFRGMETAAVLRALDGRRRVVSLGGGAVTNPAARDALVGSTVVLLEASLDTMLHRLQADDTEPRPMLASPDPRGRMAELIASRDPIYRQVAGIVVSTEGVDVDGAAERVENAVRGLVAAGDPASLSVGPEPLARLSVRSASREYPVVLGPGLLDYAGMLLRASGLLGRVRLIADTNVYAEYGSRVESALRTCGYEVASCEVAPGEASKSLDTAARLYDWLVEAGAERRDLILALGGGVVGDLAGFIAATFLRGLRLVQMPTSLLAQVDSSVGGKVAVNHPRGKNLIGAFYPPSLVIADTTTLSTLPRRELSAAFGELVKHGVILDEQLFAQIEQHAEGLLRLDHDLLDPIIARSIGIKSGVVEQDERESGIRAILNYGHTIGHAVEAVSEFARYRHGEGVAIGMVGAAEIAVELGILDSSAAVRQRDLLGRLSLPVGCPGLDVNQLLAAMGHDKKASGGKLTWVLPEAIGRVVVRQDVPTTVVKQVLESLVAE
jgi:shikimate kinase / 3-dehydroquinate synthase